MDEKRVAMLPVFFVGGGEGGGDAITVQRKKSRDGGEACGEKSDGCDTAIQKKKSRAKSATY